MHRGTKSASACTSDLDTCSNDGDDEDKDECGTNASANAKEPLPFPRTLAISMVEVNSHRRATATYTVEALPNNRCRLLSTLAIVPNGLFGRIMFLFLSCCINRSMTADLLVDLDDIAEYFLEEQQRSVLYGCEQDVTGVGGGDEVESESQ